MFPDPSTSYPYWIVTSCSFCRNVIKLNEESMLYLPSSLNSVKDRDSAGSSVLTGLAARLWVMEIISSSEKE